MSGNEIVLPPSPREDLQEAPIVVFWKPFSHPATRDGLSVTVRGFDPAEVADRLYRITLAMIEVAAEFGYHLAETMPAQPAQPATHPVVQRPALPEGSSWVDRVVVEYNNEKGKNYLAVYVVGKQYPIRSYLAPEAWTKFSEEPLGARGTDAKWAVGTTVYPHQGDPSLAVELTQDGQYTNIKRLYWVQPPAVS
jgi:hypothetical protein